MHWSIEKKLVSEHFITFAELHLYLTLFMPTLAWVPICNTENSELISSFKYKDRLVLNLLLTDNNIADAIVITETCIWKMRLICFLFWIVKVGVHFIIYFQRKYMTLCTSQNWVVMTKCINCYLIFMFSEKLGGCKVRVTSRIKKDTFDGILKLGSGLKKKKKGGKKVHDYQ